MPETLAASGTVWEYSLTGKNTKNCEVRPKTLQMVSMTWSMELVGRAWTWNQLGLEFFFHHSCVILDILSDLNLSFLTFKYRYLYISLQNFHED